MISIYNPSPMLSSQEILEFEWEKVNWLLLNEGEAARLLEVLGDGSKSLEKLKVLRNVDIIITKGAEGVDAFFCGGHISRPAGKVTQVLDTTGAGDCFTVSLFFSDFPLLLTVLTPSTQT